MIDSSKIFGAVGEFGLGEVGASERARLVNSRSLVCVSRFWE